MVLLLHACGDEFIFFFFQAEDGIRDLVRSRGLGDVYKRQLWHIDPGAEHRCPAGIQPRQENARA